MAEDIIDILVTNYNDNVTLELDPAVTVVNISNLSGLTGIIIPSGTVGRLPYYDTASTFADSGIYTNGTIVGINNDTPTLYSTNKGMVVRNPAGNVELLLQHDGNTANSIQGLSISTVKTDAAYIFQRENLPLKIGTNDTSRIFISGGGNVGINTSSPVFQLDVNGNGRFSGILTLNGYYTNSGVANRYYNSDNSNWATIQGGSFTGSSLGEIKIMGGSGDGLLISNSGAATFSNTITATKIKLTALPTSASGLISGEVWNDSGTLKIV